MIENIKKYYPFVLTIGVIVLSVLLYQTKSTLKQERENYKYQVSQNEKNFNALRDSLTTTFNKKLDAWEFSKDNFVVQKLEDLEKYNKELTEELEKVKGDVIAALQSQVQADLGGITTTNDSVKVLDETTNHYGIDFNSAYADSGFQQKIEGTTMFFVTPNEITKKWNITPDKTLFTKNLTTIKITYGFKELDDRYQVFALTPSPKVKLLDLNGGYFIDKQPPPPPQKTKRWGFGPYFGYGVISNNDISNTGFGFSLGVAIHYDIFQW